MNKSLLALLASLAFLLAPSAHAADPGAVQPKPATAQPKPATADQKTSDPKTADKQKSAEKIDINSASVEQLQTLKGIGPVRSEAIVKGRPYKGKDELVQRKVIPQSVYDGIKDRIIAKQ